MSGVGGLELYDLGRVPWRESQLVYHALPRLGRPALVVCWPDRPYLCLGFSQDLEAEVDLDYCARAALPIFRRAVGGGLVYLDSEQIFFQVVLPRREGPFRQVGETYRRCLEPALKTLAALGLSARFRPAADLTVGGRKISGNGGGDLGGHPVVVGNLLVDFDFETMAAALRAPDDFFRSRVRRCMAERLTTLRRELGAAPPRRLLRRLLIEAFASAFGPFRTGAFDAPLAEEMARLGEEMADPNWPDHPPRVGPSRDVKIAEGLYVRHRRSTSHPLAATWVEEEGRLREVAFSGEAALGNASAWGRLAGALAYWEVDDPAFRLRVREGARAAGIGDVPWEEIASLFGSGARAAAAVQGA